MGWGDKTIIHIYVVAVGGGELAQMAGSKQQALSPVRVWPWRWWGGLSFWSDTGRHDVLPSSRLITQGTWKEGATWSFTVNLLILVDISHNFFSAWVFFYGDAICLCNFYAAEYSLAMIHQSIQNLLQKVEKRTTLPLSHEGSTSDRRLQCLLSPLIIKFIRAIIAFCKIKKEITTIA